MKAISRKHLLIGIFVAIGLIVILSVRNSKNGAGRYTVAVGGAGGNNYSVCVTDTVTGETKCQQGGGPKTHNFSPEF